MTMLLNWFYQAFSQTGYGSVTLAGLTAFFLVLWIVKAVVKGFRELR